MEKAKEENIKRWKRYLLWRRQNTEKEKEENIWRRKIFGEGKLLTGGEERGGKGEGGRGEGKYRG